MIKRDKFLLKLLCFSTLLFGITSCQLFENDVADFFEKYTETAAIESHNISVHTYDDGLSQLCIASEEDAEITLYMRNPKNFNLLPSVYFDGLDTEISRGAVEITQTDSNTIILSLPQDFLIPSDEGKDITANIRLYEPMSGRDFDSYNISLHCNTKPPLVLNPTIINNANSSFVVAFDMPSPEEVAIRHKDISAVEINGQSYSVTVSTYADPDIEGSYLAEYIIDDPHFSRTPKSSYIFIGGKDFTAKSGTSFYFETDDTFFAGDKEYSVVLKDSAGLVSSVKASTSVSKLNMPVLKDQNGNEISENGISGIPFDEDTMQGKLIIEPPLQDHLGNSVSGSTVYYKIYEATGSGRIYTSGSTKEITTVELPRNTYRVEAYAALTNYENSSTATAKFRFINNALYVRTGAENGDGSEVAPYATIAEALADINARAKHETMFTIYAEDSEIGRGDEDVVITGSINTDRLTISKKPGADSATIKSLKILPELDSTFRFTANGLTIQGSASDGITVNADIPVTLINNIITENYDGIGINDGNVTVSGCEIINNTNDGISLTGGSLTVTGGTISNPRYGINGSASNRCEINVAGGIISGCQRGILTRNDIVTISGGTITENDSYGLSIVAGKLTVSGGTISKNGNGIYVSDQIDEGASISGGNIINNTGCGLRLDNVRLVLTGGSITGNQSSGILLALASLIEMSGSPIVKNNTADATSTIIQNMNLNKAGITVPIRINGALKTGCDVGITTATVPSEIGQKIVFTENYGTYNSDSPSKYFKSDEGFSIVSDGTGSEMQAAIGLVGATGSSNYTAYDYTFSFEVENNIEVVKGQSKTISVTPKITRNENTTPATTKTLTYNASNHKLYDGDVLDPSCSGSNDASVALSAAIYNGDVLVSDITDKISAGSGSVIKITIPAMEYEDSYIIKFHASFLNRVHEATIDFAVVDSES